jgi:DNA-directed RNA polymerase specialized sigma24 family protein
MKSATCGSGWTDLERFGTSRAVLARDDEDDRPVASPDGAASEDGGGDAPATATEATASAPKSAPRPYPAILSSKAFREFIYDRTRGQRSDRDDLTQNVMTVMIEKWCKHELASDEELRKVASGALKNIVLKHARKAWVAEGRASETSPDELLANEPVTAADRVDIDRVLSNVYSHVGPDNQRAIVILEALCGLKTYQEAAERQGASLAATEKAAQRLRDKLQATLKRNGYTAASVLGAFVILVVVGGLHLTGEIVPVQDALTRLVHPRPPFEYTPRDWSTPRSTDVSDPEVAKFWEAREEAAVQLLKGEVALKQGEFGACAELAGAATRFEGGDAEALAKACATGRAESVEAKAPRAPKKTR